MIRVSSANEDKRIEVILRLRRYRSKVAEYQACKELYDSLFPSAVQVLSDMPMYRGDVFEPERWAMKREAQEERMQNSLDEMRNAIDEVAELVDHADGLGKVILIRRYFLGQGMEEISKRIGLTSRHAYRLHDSAVNKIARKVGK